MKITRENLVMMLDEMNKCGAEFIKLEVDVLGYDIELRWVDFDACEKDGAFIKTLLTL